MALYKPSNFYPNMNEVDLEDENGAEFECKIHANGDEVNAYKLNIYTEDGVQVYEQYKNLEEPLKDGDFLKCKVEPYEIDFGEQYFGIFPKYMNSTNVINIDTDNVQFYFGPTNSFNINEDKNTFLIQIKTSNFIIGTREESGKNNEISLASINIHAYDNNNNIYNIYLSSDILKDINNKEMSFLDFKKKYLKIDDAKRIIKITFFQITFYYPMSMEDTINETYINNQNFLNDIYIEIKNIYYNCSISEKKISDIANTGIQKYSYEKYSILEKYSPYDFDESKRKNKLHLIKCDFYYFDQHIGVFSINDVEYDNEFGLTFYFNQDIPDKFSKIKFSFKNDFNYKWDIRLYDKKLDLINKIDLIDNMNLFDINDFKVLDSTIENVYTKNIRNEITVENNKIFYSKTYDRHSDYSELRYYYASPIEGWFVLTISLNYIKKKGESINLSGFSVKKYNGDKIQYVPEVFFYYNGNINYIKKDSDTGDLEAGCTSFFDVYQGNSTSRTIIRDGYEYKFIINSDLSINFTITVKDEDTVSTYNDAYIKISGIYNNGLSNLDNVGSVVLTKNEPFIKKQAEYTVDNNILTVECNSDLTNCGIYVPITNLFNKDYFLGKTITISYDAKTEFFNTTCINLGYLIKNSNGEFEFTSLKQSESIQSSNEDFVSAKIIYTFPENFRNIYENFCMVFYSSYDGTPTSGDNLCMYKNIQVKIGEDTSSYSEYNYSTKDLNNYICNGEFVGTKNNIILYNMDEIYLNSKKNKDVEKYIVPNNYIEVNFSGNNSNIFDQEKKYNKTYEGKFENFSITNFIPVDIDYSYFTLISLTDLDSKSNQKKFLMEKQNYDMYIDYGTINNNTYTVVGYEKCTISNKENLTIKDLNIKSRLKKTYSDGTFKYIDSDTIPVTIAEDGSFEFLANHITSGSYLQFFEINNVEVDVNKIKDNIIYFAIYREGIRYLIDFYLKKIVVTITDKKNSNNKIIKTIDIYDYWNNSNKIYSLSIPTNINSPIISVVGYMSVSDSKTRNFSESNNYNDSYFKFRFSIFYHPIINKSAILKLQDDSINLNNYNSENMFLEIYQKQYVNTDHEKLSKKYFEQIKSFNETTKEISLTNTYSQNKILEDLQEKSNDQYTYDIFYNIVYHQREKILDNKKYIGNKYNLGMIIIENQFDYNLNDFDFCQIYECDCKLSYTTIYLEKNDEIVVGRYIRFPNIDEKSLPKGATGESFKYVKETEFQISSTNNKKIIYKIIGYDDDTGEVRLETYNNNLGENYIYSRYDQFEIWEEVEYSGDLQNDYFTRKYPSPDEGEINNYANWEDRPYTIIGKNIKQLKCMSNTLYTVFLQNNINIKNDKFYTPQLRIDNENYNIILQTDLNEYNELEDKSLNRIENQQIQVNIDKELNYYNKQYKVYSAFVDSFPESYFYAKEKSKIILKYGEYYYYLNNVKEKGHVKYNNWIDNIENLSAQTSYEKIVYDKNVIFVATFEKNIEIKRYKYELYSSETGELLKEIDYVYGDNMLFNVYGLINNESYTLILYVETEYNGEYKEVYNLLVQTTEDESPNPFPNIVSNNSISSLCGNEIILNYDWDPMDKIIYVNDGYSKLDTLIYYKYIPEINFSKKKYALLCYNLRNNYNYQLKIYRSLIPQMPTHLTYQYTISQFKTCMNSYTLMDIVKIDDETYESGDRWSFKYNLEAGDTTINNSIAKSDTIGQYQRLSIGKRKYESGTISCLIGDVDDCNYTEFDGNNNINKLLKCKEFISNGNLKLLKDYKGNKFIVNTAENLSYKIDTNSNGQNTTISFTWAEAMSSDNISIRDFIELTE